MSFLTHVARGFLAKHGFMHRPLGKQRTLSLTQMGDAPHKRRRVFMGECIDDATDGSSLMQIPNLQVLSLKSSSSQVLDDSVSLVENYGTMLTASKYHEGTQIEQVPAKNCPRLNSAQQTEPPPANTSRTRRNSLNKQGFSQRCTISSSTSRSRSDSLSSVPTWLRSALEV